MSRLTSVSLTTGRAGAAMEECRRSCEANIEISATRESRPPMLGGRFDAPQEANLVSARFVALLDTHFEAAFPNDHSSALASPANSATSASRRQE